MAFGRFEVGPSGEPRRLRRDRIVVAPDQRGLDGIDMLQEHAQREQGQLHLGRRDPHAEAPRFAGKKGALDREAEALHQAVPRDHAEIGVQVEQAPRVVAQREAMHHARMAEPPGRPRQLEAGCGGGFQKRLRVRPIDEEIEILVAAKALRQANVALPMTVPDAGGVETGEQTLDRSRDFDGIGIGDRRIYGRIALGHRCRLSDRHRRAAPVGPGRRPSRALM